jgi:DNA primase
MKVFGRAAIAAPGGLVDNTWPRTRGRDGQKKGFGGRPSPFQPGQLGRVPQRRFGAPQLLDAPLPASDSLKSAVQVGSGIAPREALLLRTMINHPWLLDDQWEEVSTLDFASPLAQRVRDAILAHHVEHGPLDTEALLSQLRNLGLSDPLETIEAAVAQRRDRFSDPLADQATVSPAWRHLVALHRRDEHSRQVAEAFEDWKREQSDEAWARLEAVKKSAPSVGDLDEGVAA